MVRRKSIQHYKNNNVALIDNLICFFSASAAVTQKTKALFNMFGTSYEPELMGGSRSVASRIVADHKVQKTNALFEMFNLT
jgi:hypothetical protein